MSELVITIRIQIPEGVSVSLSNGTVPDDFENEPLPPEPADSAEQFAPVAVAPVVRTMATAQPRMTLSAGDVHAPGHKALKGGAKGGLFCPTKLTDGSWCQFRA